MGSQTTIFFPAILSLTCDYTEYYSAKSLSPRSTINDDFSNNFVWCIFFFVQLNTRLSKMGKHSFINKAQSTTYRLVSSDTGEGETRTGTHESGGQPVDFDDGRSVASECTAVARHGGDRLSRRRREELLEVRRRLSFLHRRLT